MPKDAGPVDSVFQSGRDGQSHVGDASDRILQFESLCGPEQQATPLDSPLESAYSRASGVVISLGRRILDIDSPPA